jgi:hypothetical protein
MRAKCRLLVLAAFGALSVASGGAAARGPAGAVRCPGALMPLGANAIGPAVTAALRGDRAANRPQVTAALLAPSDPQRGVQAKVQCGSNVWRRTVVVYITDRAFLPAQSASQRVVFVGRTPAGYEVWQRIH